MLGASLAAAVAAAAPEPPQKTDLFTAGEGRYALYRIPGMVHTANGTLLAYCEARKNAGSDWGAIDVWLRRSTDHGKTWEAARQIVEPPAGPKNPVAVRQGLGRDGEVTVNNPVAIADRKAGVVHFLFCVEYARCYYMRSEDDGRTFSRPVEITRTFEKFRPEYAWQVLATGPGHGIQLRTGRLVIPVWLSTGTGGHAHRPSCVSTLYSDDGGRTWERGEIVVNHPTLVNPSETAAAELTDGRVLLNIRHEGKEQRRAFSISPDGAREWSPVALDPALPDPVCMGSLARVPGGPLLFSNPHNGESRERKNLTVKLSEDDGKTWPAAAVLEPGPSGYSDLAAARDGTVYCFYERGATGTRATQPAALTLARFNLAWVRAPGQ
jgi:sialidase-1